jgi:hypothetical protein
MSLIREFDVIWSYIGLYSVGVLASLSILSGGIRSQLFAFLSKPCVPRCGPFRGNSRVRCRGQRLSLQKKRFDACQTQIIDFKQNNAYCVAH